MKKNEKRRNLGCSAGMERGAGANAEKIVAAWLGYEDDRSLYISIL